MLLEVQSVTRSSGRTRVSRGPKGDRLDCRERDALLGPNGSGKTLLRIVAGIHSSKVLVASAYITEPALLADDVFAGLDPKSVNRSMTRKYPKNLARRTPLIILTTHRVRGAEEIAGGDEGGRARVCNLS